MEKRVRVTVTPSARRERVAKVGGVLHISVKEDPVQNQVNRRVAALLAHHFGVLARHVKIETGHRSRTKTFLVTMNSYQQ